MAESAILRSVLQALTLRGAWAWRANSGMLPVGSGDAVRYVRGAPSGTPDVLGILPGGRLFGIEVKTPTGRVRPAQREWMQKAEKYGVRVGIARSAHDALSLYEAWVAR